MVILQFVFRSCANDLYVHLLGDSVTIISRNYQSLSAAFKFLAFLWKENADYPMYLHCKVRVCDNFKENCNKVSILHLYSQLN